MTRAEILDCLTDRPCDSCKFHESGRCERWNCVFEEKPDDAEESRETDDYENEIADLQNRLDIAEYDRDRWKEKVTVLEEKLKSLSAEPCEDCVSLRDVIRTIDWWVYYREPDCRQLVIWLKERINELPSVTPKQTDALDKIRAEIKEQYGGCGLINDGLDMALSIIDKYKAERGEKE